MILSDTTIRQRLDNGELVLTAVEDEQIQPASLDVRLGWELYDCFEDEYSESDDTHELVPGRRYLGHTVEHVCLPNDVAAQLAGRSSIGRMGVIVHKTAGWVDPGFSGSLTLELMNLGDQPVTLDVGQRIAQLVFFGLDRDSSGYDGQYQYQNGPTISREGR